MEIYEHIKKFFDNNSRLATPLVYTELAYKQARLHYWMNNYQEAEAFLQQALSMDYSSHQKKNHHMIKNLNRYKILSKRLILRIAKTKAKAKAKAKEQTADQLLQTSDVETETDATYTNNHKNNDIYR